MIKVNVTTHTNTVTIPTGAIVTCDFTSKRLEWDPTAEVPSVKEYEVEFGLYPSKSYNEWKANSAAIINPIDEFPLHYRTTLTEEDFNALTNVSALIILKNLLEAEPGIGVGNCEIVDPNTGVAPV